MLHGWDSFYLLIGSAAAALIGLLFVVATLTAGREASSASRGAHLYMTPTVFHLALVLLISALALTPGVTAPIAGAALGAAALIGFVYAAMICIEFLRGKAPEVPHWSDVWYYAVIPAAIYLGFGAMAILFWRALAWAPYGAALMVVVLLLTAIRNAWDLVTWLAPRRG